MSYHDAFSWKEGATLCLNFQLKLSLSARSATVDTGVTTPSPATHQGMYCCCFSQSGVKAIPQTKGL